MSAGNFLFADDLNAVLRRKHAARGFRELTAYIEACESGSMFEGLLGPELNVYATTAANAEESSWGTYCPGALAVCVGPGGWDCIKGVALLPCIERTPS